MNTGEGFFFGDGSLLGRRLFGEPGPETEPRKNAKVRLGRALAEGTHAGVVIHGDAGSGRRLLADAAAGEFAPDRARINVVGTRYGRGIEYGAILFLLAELEPEESGSIGAIMAGLTRHLAQQGNAPLVFIEHPEELDALSGNLLAQLALQGSIFVIVICDDQQGLGADLASLMRSSKLLSIEVGPLSLPEASTHMAAMLGGPVAELAVGTLWHASEGNQLWLDALIHESAATGALRCDGGPWVFAGERVPLGGAVGQLAAGRISRLTPEERRVIRILALHRRVPVGLLRKSFPTALDSLYASGHVLASPLHVGTARLASRMLRWAIRDSHGEARQLVEAEVAADAEPERTLFLGDSAAVPGAGTERDYDACEREVRRLLNTGRFGEADDVAAAFHRRLHAGPESGRLARAWAWLNADTLLLRADLAGRSGDTAGQSRLTGELLGGQGATSLACLSDSHRYLLTAQSAEVKAQGDGQERAVSMIGQVLSEIRAHGSGRGGEPAVASRQVQPLVRSMLGALVAAGAWTQARDMTLSILSGSCPHPEAIAAAGTWEGLLAVLDADGQTALHYLETALPQLKATGDARELELVRSALALCHAESGRGADAVRLLPVPPAGMVHGATGPATVLALMFQVSAMAHVEPLQPVRDRVNALVELAEESPSPVVRMLVFGLAAQLGCKDSVAKLAEAAALARGPLADGMRLLADGMILHDSATVAKGLKALVECGYSRMAMPQRNAFTAVLTVAERRQLNNAVGEHRRARSRLQSASQHHPPRHVPLEDVAEFGLLTQRERDVAAAVVEGLTNLEIAKRGAVSIRTVEGHLYQVYAKLRVKGRRELVSHISTIGRGASGPRR